MKIKYRRYYFYYLLKMTVLLVSMLPLKVSLWIADILGKVAFRVASKYRKVAIDNLDSVFSDDHDGNVRIAEGLFKNLARNGAEWIKMFSLPPDRIGDIVSGVEGREHLDSVLSKGRGCVVMGFHYGNWELLGTVLRLSGYDGALVAKRIYFYKYDKFINRMRKRFDERVIYRDESPKKMLRELRNGNVLGIVPDQDVSGIEGVFVDFFGREAYTPTAPVKLAMAAKTDIVPTFVIRKKDGTNKLVIEKPLGISPEDSSEEAVKRYTQKWTKVLEERVRENPEQWVWIHERWKTRPSPLQEAKVQGEEIA